eukprot:CAMPEP_0182797042 /NCGR_PEP_ID=MMETSP0006_2-20121128/598_1 /TAXON_ID=97485 /ORGANISM="Prymnesium parvum, Strain Texoma1" /LENGTH=40 /DNA_ID= /DNA_START= /DNA_END= /DNA_ORIENTATION=
MKDSKHAHPGNATLITALTQRSGPDGVTTPQLARQTTAPR